MSSSVDDVLDLFADQFDYEETKSGKKSGKHGSGSGSQWSVDKVASLLNIEVDDADQVEGNLLFTFAGTKRFFAFDNHTIEQIPEFVKDMAQSLRNGERFNYTKMYNQMAVKVAFPTAMGLPFVYSLQVPTYISLGGEAQLKTHPSLASGSKDQVIIPQLINATIDFQAIYATKVQSKLGFITPFNHQRYLAGYDSNVMVNLPIRGKVDVDVQNNKVWAKLQPLYPNKYQKLAEYSTIAYTTRHNILDLTPPQDDNNAEIAHIRPIKRFQSTVGQRDTGFAFDLEAETEQKHFDMAYFMNGVQRHDYLSALLHYNKEQVIKPYTNYTVSFNPQRTTAKHAKLTLHYDDETEEKEGSEDRQQNSAIPSSTAPDSWKRAEQMLKRAGAGIRDSYAQVVDMSVEFVGETNAQFVASAAYGRSPVSPKSRVLFFLARDPAQTTSQNKPYQIAVELNSKMPMVPLAHYKKALSTDPKSTLQAQINFGEKAESGGQIKIKGVLEQTEERRRYVEELPLAHLCEQQMQQGNHLLPACRNVTARANYLDHYNFEIEYQKVPDVFKNLTYKAYSLARYMAYPYVSENIVNASNSHGKIEFDVDFAPDLRSVNVSIDGPEFSTEFTNVRVSPYVYPALVIHPEYDITDRVGQKLFRGQQYPTCVVDKTYATTFDNKTYPVNLGKCWHVVVQSTPQPHYDSDSESTSTDDYETVSILVRDVESQQRELMIILGETVVTLQPSSGGPAEYFLVNGEKVHVTKDVMAHYEDKNGNTIVQVYKLPTGAFRLYTPEHGFEVIYDGLRIKIQAPNDYRGEVRGLCGTFDGETVTDFTTPKNCILKNPFQFAATYAVPDSSCQGPAKELRQRAQTADCYRQTVMLGDVISENEAGRRQPRPQRPSKASHMSAYQSQSCETKKRTKILEEGNKICFSLNPQPTCSSPCEPSKKIEKKVEFHCIENSNAAQMWVQRIKQGANPDFSKKGSNLKATIKLPKSCVQPQ